MQPPGPRAQGVGHTDADGVVQDFQRVQRESERTKLERMLWRKIEEAGLPEPDEFEFRWARSEGRQYRSDGFYRLPIPTLIEVDGGTWISGGHSRGSGFEHDRRRDNLAALMGYRILRFTKEMVRDGTAVSDIRRALAGGQQTAQRSDFQQALPTYNGEAQKGPQRSQRRGPYHQEVSAP